MQDRFFQAARMAQRLAGPAEALMSTQRLILEDMEKTAQDSIRNDLKKVLVAAERLVSFVNALRRGEIELERDTFSHARLRHDLRTPINTIIGYSELVLEEFGHDLAPETRTDCESVVAAARQLLLELETLDPESPGLNDGDDEVLRRLETTISNSRAIRQADTGTILIIDDEASNREVFHRQLGRRGHTVKQAASAEEAFALLEKNMFDLILIDILMPGINGIEALQRIKSDERWRNSAVVMISGLSETSAVAACISAGADDYLQKPIEPVLLHARIEACLERCRWREKERGYVARIEQEKKRADALLDAVLPASIIDRLNKGESHIADRFEEASIVFADIVGFTPLVAEIEPTELLSRLAALFETFDDIADRVGVEKIKTIGDAYMVASGIPHHRNDHAQAALEFSQELLRATALAEHGLPIRVGLHTGPVIAGLIGRKRFVYDVWGETVNLASRLEASGEQGRVHLSEEARSAIGLEIADLQVRTHDLKGIGRITSYLS